MFQIYLDSYSKVIMEKISAFLPNLKIMISKNKSVLLALDGFIQCYKEKKESLNFQNNDLDLLEPSP